MCEFHAARHAARCQLPAKFRPRAHEFSPPPAPCVSCLPFLFLSGRCRRCFLLVFQARRQVPPGKAMRGAAGAARLPSRLLPAHAQCGFSSKIAGAAAAAAQPATPITPAAHPSRRRRAMPCFKKCGREWRRKDFRRGASFCLPKYNRCQRKRFSRACFSR